MAQNPQNPTREDRLAAKLRENLLRRKAQAREMRNAASGGPAESGTGESHAGLPKEHRKS